MIIQNKELSTGFKIPLFALGTWEMGGRKTRIENYNPEKDIQAIQGAYSEGIKRFDTAEIYADGYSEEILGIAIKDMERKDLFITSKVRDEKLHYDDVLSALEASLKRLNLEYLDLYLIHAPNPNIPIEETMKAFNRLKDEGLIKNIGVCNFNQESLRKAQAVSSSPIVLNQVHYNLIFREPAVDGVLEYCQKNDIFIEAWRPIQQGNLCRHGIKQLDDLCEKYKKSPAQIAINWLICQKNIVTLSKTSNLEHLRESLGALDWRMDEDDIKSLEKDFVIQLERSNAVRLG
jgi:diketogulonate reductase-like aldo/keto reductase